LGSGRQRAELSEHRRLALIFGSVPRRFGRSLTTWKK
jgi:hypothetical protein